MIPFVVQITSGRALTYFDATGELLITISSNPVLKLANIGPEHISTLSIHLTN